MLENDALQLAIDTAQAASRVNVVALPGDAGKGRVYLDTPSGIRVEDFREPARKHGCTTLRGFADQCRFYGAKRPITTFVGGSSVVGVLDDGDDRRHTLNLPLRFTEAFAELSRLASNPKVDQKQLVRTLRVTFGGLVEPASLIEVVRAVRFSETKDGGGEVRKGRESLDASVVREAHGASEFPEDIFVRTAVFEDMATEAGDQFSTRIECEFDVDVENRCFIVRPKAASMTAAKRGAMLWLVDRLREAEVAGGMTVFEGTP